ncbi:hypothetical protein CYMTET_43061 [Cymbomonas tetramitiformis]|uniref:Nucleotide-diphospho-sugar transferase domain-containing protein n=1 Tax=Cymbomonas tetramitiformis TaxID=36881 RepID=A0AAE0C2T2_9CHLO|nr:hypothetical protein CYMTET_43061 [Cymbomonas tetramitiformis]
MPRAKTVLALALFLAGQRVASCAEGPGRGGGLTLDQRPAQPRVAPDQRGGEKSGRVVTSLTSRSAPTATPRGPGAGSGAGPSTGSKVALQAKAPAAVTASASGPARAPPRKPHAPPTRPTTSVRRPVAKESERATRWSNLPKRKETPLRGAVPLMGSHCFPSTLKKDCPSGPATLFGSADLNTSISRAGNCRCLPCGCNGTIVLTVVNSAFVDLMELQFESVARFAPRLLNMWVVVALDEAAFEACKRMWRHCALDEAFSAAPDMSQGHTYSDARLEGDARAQRLSKLECLGGEEVAPAGSSSTRICWRRVELVSLAVRMGFDVMFADVDVVFLRDPRPYLRTDVDLQFGPNSKGFERTSEAAYQVFPGTLNAGFYHIRATRASLLFLMAWLEEGRVHLHEADDIYFHEGMGTGAAGELAIAKYNLNFWWLDPKYMPVDKHMYTAHSNVTCAAIVHAAPGSEHVSKADFMQEAIGMKFNSSHWDDPMCAPQEFFWAGTGPDGNGTAKQVALEAPARPGVHCFPTSRDCPASNNTLRGNGLIRQMFDGVANYDPGEGSLILSLFHMAERAFFDEWTKDMQTSLKNLRPWWVVVTTDPEAQSYCLAAYPHCVLDTAKVKYGQVYGSALRTMLQWRLVELMYIAIKMEITVTASDFRIKWFQDAREYLDQDVDVQLAITGSERELSCNRTNYQCSQGRPCSFNTSACPLGPVLEGLYQVQVGRLSPAFCANWLGRGFEKIQMKKELVAPSTLVVKAMKHMGRFGSTYKHMDYRAFPGDEGLFESAKAADQCRVAIRVLPQVIGQGKVEGEGSGGRLPGVTETSWKRDGCPKPERSKRKIRLHEDRSGFNKVVSYPIYGEKVTYANRATKHTARKGTDRGRGAGRARVTRMQLAPGG